MVYLTKLESVNFMAKTKSKKRLTKTGLVILILLPLLIFGGIAYLVFNNNLFSKQTPNTMENTNENSNNTGNNDNEKPIIKFSSDILRTKVGTEIDLLSGVSATDSANKDLPVSVEGTYDFDKSGTYKLKYTAEDSNGHKANEEFTLKVYGEGINLDLNLLKDENSYKTFTTSKGYQGIEINGVTYIEGYIVANKTYSVPQDYGTSLEKETEEAFNKMLEAAKKDGITLSIQSGFRSYDLQSKIYNRHVTTYSQEEADTYSARPGHSEHQTGTAMDLNWVDEALEDRADGKWLFANAYKYGFTLRYPKGKDNETGYMYEPWHYRYVGKELAEKLYNNGDWITVESYFGITSTYAN